MHVLDALDAPAVRRWVHQALQAIEGHQREIDELNVFPIADSDTGTNLALTLRAAVDALDADGTDEAAQALRVFARGAVLGARGNSGVIMAQLLRSLADAAIEHRGFTAATVRTALERGAVEARKAVAEPVEGTILTVVRAAADALPRGEVSLGELLCAATEAADAALQRTTRQLAALTEAGVVDAGGRGFVILLDSLARHVGAEPVLTAIDSAPPAEPSGEVGVREMGSAAYAYEVQYLLDAADGAVPGLRRDLAAAGDSVVVTGTGDGTWNVHVHVNDVGAAIEAGIRAGRPWQVSVVRFTDQLQTDIGATLIAIAPGEGLGRLFESEGVHVVAGDAPSTDDVLDVIRAADAVEVILLPNASRVTGVAEAAAERARRGGVRVAVVPTRSPVQGLAAVAVHDQSKRFDDDVVAMAEAAAATRFAEVTVAQAEALTSVGICQPGDVLGLIDGEVVEIGHDVLAVAFALIDRLLGVGAELLTVLLGAQAGAGLGGELTTYVRDRSQLTEIQVYDVGQPTYPLIIGVE
ncbi:MAG: Dak phosphatase [Jatrophihabitans sp.]|nr:Dak phosphatase [Jatrophihabitans sp.]